MTHIVLEQTKKGVLHLIEPNAHTWDFNFKNTVVEQQLTNNPELESMFEVAKQDIHRQTIKAGNAISPASYTTTLNSFGTFNCDRFKNMPPNQMATVTIPYTGDAKVSFYVAGTNSYMYAVKTSDGYSATLPKGLPIKAVFVTFTRTNGPMLSIRQTTITSDEVLIPEPQSVSMEQLHQALAAL
jgi:hypothetical protein